MKIKLLNDGGFIGLGNVNFPAEVEAIYRNGRYKVSRDELVRVGGLAQCFAIDDLWNFFSSEVEVIHES